MRSTHLTLIHSRPAEAEPDTPTTPIAAPALRVVRASEETNAAPRPEPDDGTRVTEALDQLELVDVPCPPMLGTALGYAGARRYVAIVRSSEPAPLRLDDGTQAQPADTGVWRALAGHSCARQALDRWLLDDALPHPRQALLVDLDELVVYAGDRDAVTGVLERALDMHRSPSALEAGCVERWLEDPTLELAV